MTDKDYVDILTGKFEAFQEEDTAAGKQLLKSEIINILEDLNEPDSDDFYIWGLVCYWSDDNKEYYLQLALDKFLKSYEKDTTNFMACLYTAHCYQDRGKLEKALSYYQKVDQEALKTFQIWRYVKLLEQIGYCYFKLGQKALGRQKFQEVLNWYCKLPIDDRAVPTEMIQCLPKSDKIMIEMRQIEDYLD